MNSFVTCLLLFGLSIQISFGQTGACNTAPTLACGQTISSSNAGAGQTNNFQGYNCAQFSGYSGNDKIFKVVIPSGGQTSAHFRLEMQTGKNLNMFLLNSCSQSACVISSEEDNIANTYREVLDVNLSPGTYYLVVDGLTTASQYQGTFTISMNCSCSCIEPANDMPKGDKLYCDNFNDYIVNGGLDFQSTRWRKWQSSSPQTVVDSIGNNPCAHFEFSTNNQPDMLYLLSNNFNNTPLSSGRFRASWRMMIPNSKKGYFNFQHALPIYNDNNNNGANWAYEVFFDGDGTGRLLLRNNGSSLPAITFSYAPGVWFDVVNILDLDTDKAELFINDNFVYKWNFNYGNPLNNGNLAAINFYVADNSYDFYIDDICIWKNIPGCICTTIYNPVCGKNGVEFGNDCFARCNLFTNEEMEPCNTVCDFGGIFIYRDAGFSGTLTASDRAPTSLYSQQCVSDAYGGNIPPNLLADIYVFSNIGTNSMEPYFNDNGNQNVRGFVFVCESQFNSDGGPCIAGEVCWDSINTLPPSIPQNSCSQFYYLVITGTIGETYSSLSVVPSGSCNGQGGSPLACGVPVSGNVSIDGFENNPNSPLTYGFNQCYNGTRQYIGLEARYKFTLAQPQKVSIKLTASTAMGVFLYPFTCGANCLGYAENTAFDPNATLTATLNEGVYYVIVDKDADFGNTGFTLQMDCEQYSPFVDQPTFIANDFSTCPTDPGVQHQMGIQYNPVYTPNDYFNFYFRNTDGKLKGNTEASRYWHNSTQPMYFDLNADVANDGEKCSYAPGDTFFVFIHQTVDGKRTYKRFEPTYAGGVADSLIFKEDGFSLITKLEEIDAVNFGTETAFMRVAPDALTVPLNFITNLSWVVEKVNGPAPWLTISPTQSPGAKVLSLTFLANNSATPRSVVLRFYSTEFPDLYRQFVTIEQQGQCTIPQAVNIVPSATSVCSGAAVTLTADVGAQYQNLYNYKWNTSDTSRIITKIPPVGSNNFSVTVTNKYCFITSTDAQGITVNALPAAPQNPVGASICQGQNNIPALSVTQPGGGLQIFWYAASSGGIPLQPNPSNTYTPPAPVNSTTIYYAETKNPMTTCVSATRTPVTLTVHTNPVFTDLYTTCAPNLLTYSITATVTNGTTVTTNPSYGGTFSNGVFTVSGIPKGTNVTLVASNPNCSVSQQVISPACLCPVITPPVSGGNKTYCPGENPPPLTVDVGTGETADWFNQMTGGDSLGTGFSFTPVTPGTYWVRARNLINNCTSSVRTPLTLTLNALPTFHILSQTCSADLTKYDLVFNSDASDASALPYLVNSLGNGVFEIKGITEGTGINIHLENVDTNCERDTLTALHLCECPDLAKPFDPVNVSVCAGSSNIPPLMVSTGPGLLANWYRNGQLQSGIPTLSFTTTTEGTYYAKTFNPVNGCESDDSTAVTLEIKPLPTLTEGPKQCAPDWLTYQVTVSSSTPALTSVPSITPTGNGNGTYTFYGVPIGVTLAVTAISNGCSNAIPIEPPVCSCPYIPDAPGDPNNPVICLGDAVPFLTVSVTIPSSETVDWYDAAVGGVKVENDHLQYKPAFAFATDTFYAQTQLSQFPNCVSARTPVILQVNQPVTTVSAGQNTSICADETLTLNGKIEGAASAVWTASPLGGVFTPNSTFISAQKYAPPAGVDSVTLTLTAYPVEPSVCPPKQHSMVLTVNPVPTVTIIQPGTCDPDLDSYSFIFDTDGDQVIFVPDIGDFSTNPDGTYTYGNIPEGQAVSIKATYVLTGCDNTLLPPAKECDCPTDIPKPESLGDKEVCEGVVQYPALVVDVPTGMTADWYDAPFNGMKLDSNKVAFLPPAPGPYYAETRDPVSGCTSQLRQVVVLSEAINPNADAGEDLTLCPGTTGTLSAFQSGNYSYTWSTGQTGPVITVPAQNATYILTVTQGNCTAKDTVVVSVLPAVGAGISLVSAIQCNGGSTGALSATAAGGTAPFKYNWSNNDTTQIAANLSAGTYSVTITDIKGCNSEVSYMLDQPAAITLFDTTIVNATNNQNNGSILAEITGGVPPYQYQWLLPNGNAFPGQNDSLLNGVFAGNYKIKVTDANGCVFVSELFTVKNIIPIHVNEPVPDALIAVFPNPTTGTLYIQFSLPSRKNAEIRVYDLLGREVFIARPGVVQSDVLEFYLSDLAAGLYLLKIDLEGSLVNKTISIKK